MEETDKRIEAKEAAEAKRNNSASGDLSSQKVRVHISAKKFTSKPEGREIGGLKIEFANPMTIQDVTVAELAKVFTSGQTVQPGITPFSEKSKAKGKGTRDEDFTQQQVFCVDTDNDKAGTAETPESAEKKLREHNLKSAFMYFSFSSTPERSRFRICIVSDEVITDRNERDRIQAGLVALFSQADTSCTNADRMYFGTDKGLCEGIGDFNARCRKADLLALVPAEDTQSEKAQKVAKIEKTTDFSSETKAAAKESAPAKTGSAEELRSKCTFINHCWEDAATLSHRHWHGAISNMAHTADGREAIHKMSEPYPEYSYEETEKQYRDAIKADKPQTCEYIKCNLGFNCGQNCGVKAPIALVHTKPIVWEEPIPFNDELLPSFPVDALPGIFQEYVAAVSESTQTPVDLPAVTALAVLSICNLGRRSIQLKPDWTEGLNTYTLAIMPPSERKSPVCRLMIRPVNTFEQEWNTQHRVAIKLSQSKKKVLEGRLKKAEDNEINGKGKAGDLEKASAELANFQELKEMKIYSDNITPEKLVSNLARNDGVGAIFSAEAGIFNILQGAYSQNVNFDVFLKGYSNEPIRVERIGRESDDIYKADLSVMLMAQPSVLAGVIRDEDFDGRGLTARFLYCKPKSYIGRRNPNSRPVSKETYERYDACLRRILEGKHSEGHEIILLSDEARALFFNFADEVEHKLQSEYADIEDWAGKLLGNVARIAGLLCVAENAQGGGTYACLPSNLIVSGKIMADAIDIGKYFVEHAKAAFSLLSIDSNIGKAKKLLEAIKKEQLSSLTRRDAMTMCSSLRSVDKVQPVLDLLVSYGYLAKKEQKYSGTGRPSGDMYFVNPKIYDKN